MQIIKCGVEQRHFLMLKLTSDEIKELEDYKHLIDHEAGLICNLVDEIILTAASQKKHGL